MKEIEYKNSKELGLKVIQEGRGAFTVMRIAPKVIVRKSHGNKYPQFFDENLEVAFNKMIKWLNENT